MDRFGQITNRIEHKFIWHPCTETPGQVDKAIIFLTDKGAFVTHKDIYSEYFDSDGKKRTVCKFKGYAAYANAIAWAYQSDLIPKGLNKTVEEKPKKKRKMAKCVIGYAGFFEEGELYKFAVNKVSGRIIVKNDNGMRVEYPNETLMLRNFEIVEI